MASKTALYYRKNKKARDKKKAYDTEYESTPERIRYRSELNKARRKRRLKGNPNDLSHTDDGRLVLESKRRNRARNGAGNNKKLK